jgi:uncharacterized membrane protein YkvA (DUF1232 family)
MDVLSTVLVVVLILLAVRAIVLVVCGARRPARPAPLDVVRMLPDVLRLTAGRARDPATPRSCKVALAGLAVWLASPIDPIPEFLPVIGPLDDIVVTAIVLRWVGRRVGEQGLRAHWPGSDDGFGLLLRMLGLAPA